MVTDAPLLTPETCSQRQCDVARTLACPERAAHGGVSNGPSSALVVSRSSTAARDMYQGTASAVPEGHPTPLSSRAQRDWPRATRAVKGARSRGTPRFALGRCCLPSILTMLARCPTSARLSQMWCSASVEAWTFSGADALVRVGGGPMPHICAPFADVGLC